MSQAKVAVVTGASRGLGLGVCRRLGGAGFRVVAACRGEEAARRVQAELRREGIDAEGVVLDVERAGDAARLAERLGPASVDVLVNNAGISMKGFDAHVAERTTDVNYRGAVRVTEALWGCLRDGARVVMVSSGMGELSALSPGLQERFQAPSLDADGLDALVREFVRDVSNGEHATRGWPSSAYRISKAAMNAYARVVAARADARVRGIAVNAVCPGWVRTDMGGEGAPRSIEQGVESITWAALLPRGGPSGGFFRDGRRIPW
jgi:NAD(P)-dependent dehydrogenase (short-subunit alcohol dehydrogenase family)